MLNVPPAYMYEESIAEMVSLPSAVTLSDHGVYSSHPHEEKEETRTPEEGFTLPPDFVARRLGIAVETPTGASERSAPPTMLGFNSQDANNAVAHSLRQILSPPTIAGAEQLWGDHPPPSFETVHVAPLTTPTIPSPLVQIQVLPAASLEEEEPAQLVEVKDMPSYDPHSSAAWWTDEPLSTSYKPYIITAKDFESASADRNGFSHSSETMPLSSSPLLHYEFEGKEDDASQTPRRAETEWLYGGDVHFIPSLHLNNTATPLSIGTLQLIHEPAYEQLARRKRWPYLSATERAGFTGLRENLRERPAFPFSTSFPRRSRVMALAVQHWPKQDRNAPLRESLLNSLPFHDCLAPFEQAVGPAILYDRRWLDPMGPAQFVLLEPQEGRRPRLARGGDESLFTPAGFSIAQFRVHRSLNEEETTEKEGKDAESAETDPSFIMVSCYAPQHVVGNKDALIKKLKKMVRTAHHWSKVELNSKPGFRYLPVVIGGSLGVLGKTPMARKVFKHVFPAAQQWENWLESLFFTSCQSPLLHFNTSMSTADANASHVLEDILKVEKDHPTNGSGVVADFLFVRPGGVRLASRETKTQSTTASSVVVPYASLQKREKTGEWQYPVAYSNLLLSREEFCDPNAVECTRQPYFTPPFISDHALCAVEACFTMCGDGEEPGLVSSFSSSRSSSSSVSQTPQREHPSRLSNAQLPEGLFRKMMKLLGVGS